jgi:hypothetical protein
MGVPVSQCSVFIQIWVDTNSVQNGQTKGIYLVDNRVSSGSQNEGSANLQAACTLNSYICWQILAIDPNYTAGGGTVAIQQIGNSNAWGMSGQPEMINSTTFTGQVQNPGQAGYSININVQNPGMSGITIQISPSVLVTAAARAQEAHSAEKVGGKA